MRHLAEAWLRLGRRVGARHDVAGAGAALLGRWTEPHRAYHDLAHLAEVLDRIDLLAGESTNEDAVRLAAWFHDAVYDPTSDSNEERSADVAVAALGQLGLDVPLLDEVSRLIRITATHDVDAGDGNAAVLCDADLAVLASDDLRYSSYVEGVRREYEHLDDAAFASGRSAILRSLASRPSLFHTAYGRGTWEAPARANMAAELARLAREF